MMNKWNIVVFEADTEGLLLPMLVCLNDVEEGEFEYTQEVAIEGQTYDAVAVGNKNGNSVVYKEVELYPYDENDEIRKCKVINVKNLEI